MTARTLLLVTGMHRSGTSAVAGALDGAGVGDHDHYIRANAFNSRGYFEDERVLAIHESVEWALGRHWSDLDALPAHWWQGSELAGQRRAITSLLDDRLGANAVWLVKDPRLCLMLPLWRDVLMGMPIDVRVVLVLRHPLAVADSLARRDNMTLPHSLLLWLSHVLSMEFETRTLPRAFVDYDQLVAYPAESLARLTTDLDLGEILPRSDWQSGDLIDLKLRHAELTGATGVRWVDLVWSTFTAARVGEGLDRGTLDRVRASLDEAVELTGPLQASLEGQIRNLKRGLDQSTQGFRASEQIVRAQSRYITDVREQISADGLQRSVATSGLEGEQQLTKERGALVEQEMLTQREALIGRLDEARAQMLAQAETVAIQLALLTKASDAHRNQQAELIAAVQSFHDAQAVLDAERRENEALRDRSDRLQIRLDRIVEDLRLDEAPGDEDEASLYDARIDLRVENNSHNKMIRLILDKSGSRKCTILEVGCATGAVGEAISEFGHEVHGVELSAGRARIAATRLHTVFVGGIQRYLAELPGDQRFDFIMFGDVLEHLSDPEVILNQCGALLKPGGHVLISVPNVSHLAVRLMLLEGRWEYQPTGILDNTHLRFFTRDTLIDMMTAVSMRVVSLDRVTLPTSRVGIDVNPRLFEQAATFVNDDEQETFQLVVAASPATGDVRGDNAAFKSREAIRVLCLAPITESTLATIRFSEPLGRWSRLYGGSVRIRPLFGDNTADLLWADVVVLQREANPFVLGLMTWIKGAGKCVIFEIDDLLTEVPAHLSVHEHCEKMRPYLEQALSYADAITVSTRPLGEALGTFNQRVSLIPNCVETVHEPVRQSVCPNAGEQGNDDGVITLVVASSDSVRVDFIKDALEQLIAEPGVTYRLVGIGPPGEALRDDGLPVEVHPLMDYEHFKAFLATLDNAIGVIPLDDSRFNRCKSAVKFLDFCAAGIPAVCSNVQPYTDVITHGVDGILCENTERGWIDAVMAMAPHDERARIAGAAGDLVRSRHSLHRSASAWQDVLRQVRSNGLEVPHVLAPSTLSIIGHMFRPASYRYALELLRSRGLKSVLDRVKSIV